jgi:hypothetical protein
METENCNLQWICETLLETYNTSILDRAEQIFKEACVLEAHKCLDQNVFRQYGTTAEKREVLSQLILNHSSESNPELPPENKKPIVNYIGGPIDLTMQWSKKYKKLIYIFGEIHSENTDCEKFKIKDKFYGKQNTMLIEDYLEQLVRNTDVFIDFYLEIGREYNQSSSRIGKIAERFKWCFYAPKDYIYGMGKWDYDVPEIGWMIEHYKIENGIRCWLSRMHYFDLRKAAKDVDPDIISTVCVIMVGLFYKLERIKKKSDGDTKEYPKAITDFLNEIDFDISIKWRLEKISEIKTDDDYNEFWDKQINLHRFLSKKVIKSSIHIKIKSFIKKEILNTNFRGFTINRKVLVDSVNKFIKTINKYLINGVYDFTGAPASDIELIADADCISQLVAINSYVADYYLLCRIFREFDISGDSITERWTDEPKEPHNIIIYAGRLHSVKIRKFLEEELEFEMIHNTNMYDIPIENCISMEDFPQPFFSNHPKVRWED